MHVIYVSSFTVSGNDAVKDQCDDVFGLREALSLTALQKNFSNVCISQLVFAHLYSSLRNLLICLHRRESGWVEPWIIFR